MGGIGGTVVPGADCAGRAVRWEIRSTTAALGAGGGTDGPGDDRRGGGGSGGCRGFLADGRQRAHGRGLLDRRGLVVADERDGVTGFSTGGLGAGAGTAGAAGSGVAGVLAEDFAVDEREPTAPVRPAAAPPAEAGRLPEDESLEVARGLGMRWKKVGKG